MENYLHVLKCLKLGKNVEARLVVGYCPSLSPLLSWKKKKSVLGHKSNGLSDMKESLRNAGRKMSNERERRTRTHNLLLYCCEPASY